MNDEVTQSEIMNDKVIQKPTLGRIVRYRLPDIDLGVAGGERVFPAMIVRVWNDNMVNLKVFLDDYSMDRWVTSVTLYPTDPGAGGVCWWPQR